MTKQSSKNKSSEDVSVNWKQVTSSLSSITNKVTSVVKQRPKSFNIALAVFFMILIVFTATSHRTGSVDLDITDRWAEETRISQIRGEILSEIRSQYPQLPDEQLQQQADRQLLQLLEDEQLNAQIFSQVDSISQQFKEQLQDDRGHTYLLAIDPYYYLRLTKNYIENGHVGEYIADNGQPASNFVTAPKETYPKLSFHVWFQALVFKVVSLFTDFTIEDLPYTVYFTPVIVMSGAAIMMFFLLRKFTGNAASLLGALYVAVHPAILTRTIGGFSDTDAYNVFFPLLIVYLIVLSVQAKKLSFAAIWSLAAGLALVVYRFAWAGSLFIFYILGATIAALFITELVWYIVTNYVKKSSRAQKKSLVQSLLPSVLTGGVFAVIALLEISIRSGLFGVLGTIFGFLQSTATIKDASISGLWPNVYTTVAELNSASYQTIVLTLGGKLLFYGGMLGILCFATYHFWNTRNRSVPNRSALFILFLSIAWYGSMIFASLKGIRFTMLLAPIVIIGIALFWGTVNQAITSMSAKNKEFNPKIVSFIIGVLLVLTIFTPTFAVSNNERISIVERAQQINEGQIPSINDAWYATLEKIRDESETDAIISSWWDFGHQFITIAERGATADGGSQNTPQAHWLGKILVESDDQKSIAVLRMLNCGANGAWETLHQDVSQDMLVSIPLLNELLDVNREEAARILQENNVPQTTIDQVLEYTHCIPPESFIVASDDMVGKAGVWAHFGLWDFEKANLRQVAKSQGVDAVKPLLIEQDFSEQDALTEAIRLSKMGEEEANVYISPFPQYFSQTAFACTGENETAICRAPGTGFVIQQSGAQAIVLEGVAVNGTTDAQLLLAQYINGQRSAISTSHPLSFSYITELGDTVKTTYDDGQTFGVSYDATSNQAVVASEQLAASTFTKLYYYGGNGANYFDLFDERSSIFGQRIFIYKINWDSYLQSIGDA